MARRPRRTHSPAFKATVAVAAIMGETTMIEYLQKNVEDFGMRLFNLVKENDRVGPSANHFRQLAAL
jgi:hypothetical protein